jgi:hypothetical protein
LCDNTKNDSNAIVQLRRDHDDDEEENLACCRYNSNAILNLNKKITNNSNAILNILGNADVNCCRYNSNALLYLIKNMSNTELRLFRNNSQALLACCKNSSNTIISIRKLVIQNSNVIASDPNIYLDKIRTFTALATTTFNHKNHFIHCSREPNLFSIAPAATLTLQNAVLKDFSPACYDPVGHGKLIFGDGTIIELRADKNDSACGVLELKNTWTFAGGKNCS